MTFFIYLANAALGLVGFLLAYHIYKEKRSGNPLVCPVGFACDTVVHSQYSQLGRLPLEVLGMIYYALVLVVYIALAGLPGLALAHTLSVGVAVASALAFLFSIYLTYLQLAVIKHLCTLCLFSAAISSAIFLLTLASFQSAPAF